MEAAVSLPDMGQEGADCPGADASVETGKMGKSVGTMVDESPVVKALRRGSKATLGDMLDPTYMDPALWMTLPMHLMELILSKVPFRNLVTMRRVCKCWNALILSEGFSPPFVPALIMFARTPTVKKMMWERSQPARKAKDTRKWCFFRIWNNARRVFKRKHSAAWRQSSS